MKILRGKANNPMTTASEQPAILGGKKSVTLDQAKANAWPIIEDQDELQKKRLFAIRDYLLDIITKYYKTNNLQDKTLCDVGCNTGYFLYEIYKKIKIKKVVGVEPRTKNLDKAKFIAKFFKLPKNKFILKKMDILSLGHKIEKFDIVIMPGVLHHLDDHILALRNLYKMTKDLCIIETVVLSNKFNEKYRILI